MVVAMVKYMSHTLPNIIDNVSQVYMCTCINTSSMYVCIQCLTELLSLMYSWCSDTYPDVYRHAIASFMGRNWNHLVYDYNSRDNTKPNCVLFWLTVINLLQDVEASVRDEMCRSITSMTKSGKAWIHCIYYYVCINCIVDSTSLCQLKTLHSVIMCIPDIYTNDYDHAINLLSAIIDNLIVSPSSTEQDKVSALLFEEDKTNSYSDPVIVMECVSLAYDKLLKGITNELERMTIDSKKATLESDSNTPEADTNFLSTDACGLNLWQMKTDEVFDIFKRKILKQPFIPH